MKPPARVALVLAGYVAALLAAQAALQFRMLHTRGQDVQASAGMVAFGDGLLYVGVLSLVGLIPTGLALYWLRPVARFWTVLAGIALLLAGSGVAAAVALEVAARVAGDATRSGRVVDPRWVKASAFAFGWIMSAPLVGSASALTALFAPDRRPRRALLAAAVTGFVVGAYSLVRLLAHHST
jgi:hypothetical protein